MLRRKGDALEPRLAIGRRYGNLDVSVDSVSMCEPFLQVCMLDSYLCQLFLATFRLSLNDLSSCISYFLLSYIYWFCLHSSQGYPFMKPQLCQHPVEVFLHLTPSSTTVTCLLMTAADAEDVVTGLVKQLCNEARAGFQIAVGCTELGYLTIKREMPFQDCNRWRDCVSRRFRHGTSHHVNLQTSPDLSTDR